MLVEKFDRNFGGLIMLVAFLVASVASQATAQDSDKNETAKTQRSETLFKHFDQTGKELTLQADSGEAYHWNPKPLFRFSTEGQFFGSVYVWTDKSDRLAVVGTIGSIPINGRDTEFVELHLLKPQPITPLRIGNPPNKTWRPEVDKLALKDIEKAPEVSTNDAVRLRQMRTLARRFSAEMIHDGQTNHLRLLPQPIFRYEKSTPDRDGALFAFVWDNGTDPEVLLRIEADSSGETTGWRYQPVRFTWRSVNLSLDDTQVWTMPEMLNRNLPMQTTPYLTGLTQAIP
ncbi:hypothetical protein [Rhodopirellula sp. MGV]|uniref:hypothetical protein n=1 Tax=Rhodopirellula sp. MGV TaxID=2023130 RepID=UPI000B961BAE|nr:hypothetical protein [Rhodopirellula sp. MGV]OYP34398.1 hypothetical protein CGZ80_15210 [Rhodopirellula sp. MGV]PNY37427.1 hypothetical protein C2E31_07815 [Rhodopirellula baltica]